MNLKVKNPLAFFDLETTGTSISRDRIIEIAIIKIMPNGERMTRVNRINPTIPIPAESSLIHGIYDEDVVDEPTFKSVAKSLAKFLEGADLSGFNIIKFDVPMLVEEFLRAGINFNIEKRKLIDSQKIFHLMEKRTLSAAYKFYCDKILVDAHSAEMDTLASLEVLEAQIDRYDGMDVKDAQGNLLGRFENNLSTLHQITSNDLVDLAGRMINRGGEVYFNFGKHKGKKVLDILESEPSYYDWIMNGDFSLDTKRRLTEIKLAAFNRK